MFKETGIPIKEKAPFQKEGLDFVYERELLPLIKIFSPSSEELDDFVEEISTELRQQAEKIQDIENRALISQEESVEDMKAILLEKAKTIIADFDNQDWNIRESGQGMDKNFYKKAKICLLRAGNFSDWNKYYSNKEPISGAKDELEDISYDSLGYYLNLNTSWSNYIDKNTSRLNSLETEALLDIGFDKQLMELVSSYSSNCFSEINDVLMQKMIKARAENKIRNIDFETCLKRIPPPGGYSSRTMEDMVKYGQGRYAFSYPHAFKENDKPEFWEELNKLQNLDYPYHLKDALSGVTKSKLSPEDKKLAIDSAFRHNLADFYNFDDYIEDEDLRNKYTELAKADFLNKPGKYEAMKPEELDEAGWQKVRRTIEDGYLGTFCYHQRREYLYYLAKTDYEWLKEIAQKYNQENLLLVGSDKILQPDDQIIYAEKLLTEGNEEILSRMINSRGLFSWGALSKEIFWDLAKDGHFADPCYFSGLDSDCLKLFLSKFDSEESTNIFGRDESIRKNIKFFGLQNGHIENNDKFLAYQELLNSINLTFGENTPSDDLYRLLNIGFSSFKSAEEIKQRQDDMVSKLSIIKEAIGHRNLSSVFSNGLDIKILDQDIDGLHEDADGLQYLFTYHAQANLNNLQILKGCSPAEKEAVSHLLGLNSLPLNKLIVQIKQNDSLEGELDQTLLKDFAIDTTNLENQNKLDFHTLLKLISQSWSENYAKYTNYNNNIKSVRDRALLGEAYPKDNDRFVRIARDYSYGKANFSNALHEFDFEAFTNELVDPEFDKNNWAGILTAYVLAMEEDEWKIATDKKEIIENYLSGPYKDSCLKSMSTEWRDFLNNKQAEELPLKLLSISETINHFGGAGNLSRIESLSGLIHSFSTALENEKVAPRTLEEIKVLLSKQEDRFEKENWSQDDKAEFHNLAKEMMEAAPSLFSAFTPIFEKMSPKETKTFLKEMMPLYHINLITIQSSPNENGEVSYDARDLVAVRSSVKRLAMVMNNTPEIRSQEMTLEKDRLSATMRANFKSRLGLENVPNNIDKEGLRLLHNFIRYTGNINERDAQKEAIISYFLALNINGDWEKFRKGEELNPRNYLSENKVSQLKDVIKERDKNKLKADIVGLKESQMSGFQDKLQAETRNSMIGNVETVDVKLGILKRNVDDLLDPDAYENEVDKALLGVCTKYHKSVGSSLAKTFQKLNGRNIVMTQDEELAVSELADVFNIKEWSQDKIKEIQERVQPISLINNMATKLADSGLEDNIQELNRFLSPDNKVIEIFNKLDENFKTGSGAIAISKDLEYLDNLLVKEKSKLNQAEVEIASNYLKAIRDKMSVLESTMDGAREYFNKVKSSVHTNSHKNELLANRLNDIEKIVNNREHDALIATEMTKDFSLIIENMRQCLGCLRKEINNDTNLAFGDYNKFFLVSKKEKAKGSIADEIVFFLPVSKPDGSRDMSFVMDRVYGSTSSDILLAHFLTVYKKFDTLKKNFKDAKISISITGETLSSAGVNADTFKSKILQKVPDLKIDFFDNNLSAEVPVSPFSDNYIEFGPGTRTTGKRPFSALIVE